MNINELYLPRAPERVYQAAPTWGPFSPGSA